MLDHETRTAILKLHATGFGTRKIARALKISRGAVKSVLESNSPEVPEIERGEKGEPYRTTIQDLLATCKGNLVRVHEELLKQGAKLSYQALTGYCRRNGIGHEAPLPTGTYTFGPGQEMQHDTSPHKVKIGGVLTNVQTASLVFCYSRRTYFQFYPRFTRFFCKVFLTDAMAYFGGACAECMVDNTHVIVLKGTGADMIPVPEMATFGERYGFVFRAHEKGDANRSARVEGPFRYIENNFLAGREFDSFEHANAEATAACDRLNAKYTRSLDASRAELFASERPHLKPLPIWVPEVYELHQRVVDDEGYVRVHPCRYSAPYELIGRQLEVRETKSEVLLHLGPRLVGRHARHLGKNGRVTDPKHRPARGSKKPAQPSADEEALNKLLPDHLAYVQQIKIKSPNRVPIVLKRLLRMVRDYPRPAALKAISTAAEYGLYDLERVESMILRNIDSEIFPQPQKDKKGDYER